MAPVLGRRIPKAPALDPRMLPGNMACYDGQSFSFVAFDKENNLQVNRAELK